MQIIYVIAFIFILLIDESDLDQLCCYLKNLNLGDIVKVGTSLGLNYTELSGLIAVTAPHEMIRWWLQKRHDVMKISGTPSLRSLIGALRKNGLNGHAKIIEDCNVVSTEVGKLYLSHTILGSDKGCSKPRTNRLFDARA